MLLAALLAVPPAAAAPSAEILTRREASVDPCQAKDDCAAREFAIVAEDYRVLIDGSYSYGTRMRARYRTDFVGDLEDYVVVQFLRGCQFYGRQDGRPGSPIVVERQGRHVPFRFPTWVVDSYDADPVYNSVPGEPRHAYYRWLDARGVERRYGQARPPRPELFVRDHPGVAHYNADAREASNIALQFKTCLFRARDVPVDGALDASLLPAALSCLDWESSLVYDHARGRFGRVDDVGAACRP